MNDESNRMAFIDFIYDMRKRVFREDFGIR